MSNIAAQLQKDWLDACMSAGIPAVTTDTAARVLAVLYVFGGEHEEMTLNVKFTQEVKYIQKRFHIAWGVSKKNINKNRIATDRLLGSFGEGKRPDPDGIGLLEKQNDPPEWAVNLYRDRYGIKVR